MSGRRIREFETMHASSLTWPWEILAPTAWDTGSWLARRSQNLFSTGTCFKTNTRWEIFFFRTSSVRDGMLVCSFRGIAICTSPTYVSPLWLMSQSPWLAQTHSDSPRYPSNYICTACIEQHRTRKKPQSYTRACSSHRLSISFKKTLEFTLLGLHWLLPAHFLLLCPTPLSCQHALLLLQLFCFVLKACRLCSTIAQP